MKIIVMGPQGSGKTTQAELLAKKLNLPHLQTGELYREIAKTDSSLGFEVKELVSLGQLVPDIKHNQILKEELGKPKYKDGFVLDGSPRTLKQAKSLPFQPEKVFYLAVSDEQNMKRLEKRGRSDDTPAIIAERLRLYHQQTEPILDYYRREGILEEVDGERSVEEIFEDLMSKLK